MMKLKLKILTVILLTLPHYVTAIENSANVKVTPLLKTSQSWDGKDLVYPQGKAEITGMLIEIAPGGETPWHLHPVPSFGMLLQGRLEITLENGQLKQMQAGDALAEVVNTLHKGKNKGTEPVKIVVFYAGAIDTALTVTPQTAKLKAENALLARSDDDKIDNLLTLINERLALAPKVAMAKWNSGAPIEDPVREAQVLAGLQRQAISQGVDPALAQYFFQAQIQASKYYQQQLHGQWRAAELAAFSPAPDLAAEVRPVIDALQGKLLAALQDVQTINFTSDKKAALQARAQELISDDFNGEARSIALSPLLEPSFFPERE